MPCPNCGEPIDGPGPFCGPICMREVQAAGLTWQRHDWPAGISEDDLSAARSEPRLRSLPPPAQIPHGTAAAALADLGAAEE